MGCAVIEGVFANCLYVTCGFRGEQSREQRNTSKMPPIDPPLDIIPQSKL